MSSPVNLQPKIQVLVYFGFNKSLRNFSVLCVSCSFSLNSHNRTDARDAEVAQKLNLNLHELGNQRSQGLAYPRFSSEYFCRKR